MTEEEARAWIISNFGEARRDRLAILVSCVADEAARQNLIAPSTLDKIWSRHVVDSAQLVLLATDRDGLWLDIGSGAGFPGLVIAALTNRIVVLAEPRARRAAFLQYAATVMGIDGRVQVKKTKVETLSEPVAVISARAVASLPSLLNAAIGSARPDTLWVLPRGQAAREEVAKAEAAWHGTFHVEHSITDPQSLIVLATGVARR